jgi:GNAT superfamily N-acetyltransferase
MRRFTYRRRGQRGAGVAASKFSSAFAGDTPLISAVRAKNIDEVDRVYTNEQLNAVNHAGDTPLHIAVEKNFLAGIIYLLRKGANPNLPNNSGETPFHNAARVGSAQIIQHLIEKGASLGPKNRENRNALNIAKQHDRTNILHIFPKTPVPAGIQTHISPSSSANRALIPDGLFDRVADPANFNKTAKLIDEDEDICTAIDDYYKSDSVYDADFIICLLTAENTLLGFSALNLHESTLHIELFCTHYRYKGLGSLLMNKIKELHDALGRNVLNLNSVQSAREFYRKQGFVENANNSGGLRHMTYRRSGGGRLKSRTRRSRKWLL